MDTKNDGPVPPANISTNTTMRLPGLPGTTNATPLTFSADPASSNQRTTSGIGLNNNGSSLLFGSAPMKMSSSNNNAHDHEGSVSPRPEDLKPMGNFMKARLYSYGGSNSAQVAQRASGLGARPSFKKESETRFASQPGIPGGGGGADGADGAAGSDRSSFIARRPSPSTKPSAATNLYGRRGGRRLKNERHEEEKKNDNNLKESSFTTFAPPTLKGAQQHLPRSELDVPLGMADSNPDIALETYRLQSDGQSETFIPSDERKHATINSTTMGGDAGDARGNEMNMKSTTRGELLRQAQNFKTFMEIMEEHPLYEMPYGDSFLYLKSVSGST